MKGLFGLVGLLLALLMDQKMYNAAIATEADYNKLKSGEEFIDPDGIHRRKP